MTSEAVVTAREFATHVECPRKHEFEHVRSLSPRREHPSVVREARRDRLARAVIAGLTADGDTHKERAAAARRVIDRRWAETAPSATVAGETLDTRVVGAALDAYFRGVGETHADGLCETNVVLSSSLDGVTYEAHVDAVVRRDGTARALVVVPDLTGVHPEWVEHSSKGIVEPFRTGEGFYPRQVGFLVRAELALRGLRTRLGFDADVDFAYLSLLGDVEPDYGTGDSPSVTPECRGFGTVCADERADLRKFLEARGPRVATAETRLSDAEREDARERCCGRCPYQDGCPDRIEFEVSFGGRIREGADAGGFSAVEPRVREER